VKPRLLANENFPAPSVAWLRQAGYDVFSIAESGKGLTDHEILDIATAEQRWVLTFDRDYGELIYAKNFSVPPAILFLRLTSYRPDSPGKLIADLLEESASFVGQFVVIRDDSLRKRPLPQR